MNDQIAVDIKLNEYLSEITFERNEKDKCVDVTLMFFSEAEVQEMIDKLTFSLDAARNTTGRI